MEATIQSAIRDYAGPIHLVGQSLGGALLQKALTNLKAQGAVSQKIKSVVIEGSFSSYSKIATDVLSRFWLTWPFQWLGYLLISDQQSPLDSIRELAPTPILVIHGDSDSVVPIRFGESIFNHAVEPKVFWRVEGGRHIDTFISPIHGQHYRQKLVEYWDQVNRNG